MAGHLKNFVKKFDWLICIDSDGTAIDSMTVKHLKSFGPNFVKVWNLEEHEKEVLSIWNDINLYSKTRGLNRFLGFLKLAEILNDKYLFVDLSAMRKWASSTKEFSVKSLKAEIANCDDDVLKKAVIWSDHVNADIDKLTYEDKKPFAHVLESLEKMSIVADIAVVSSAGRKAIDEEWEFFGLAEKVSALCSQEDGSKKHCISELLARGYDKNKVIMLGDALSDLQAAQDCGILFYPIIPASEDICWKEFHDTYFDALITGNYHQELLIEKFQNSFKQ